MRKEPKVPTPNELERIRGNEDRLTAEVVPSDVDFNSLQKAHELAPMILDDGMVEKYFSPFISVPTQDGRNEAIIPNPLYSPAYEPLRLSCSRKLLLGNMTEAEVGQFKSSVHSSVQEARTFATSKLEHCVINSIEKYIMWSVTIHARNGNTIKALTENRTFKQILTSPVEKKKRWFDF